MTTERMVDSLDSVFDLRIHRALNLPESVSTRVMLTYRKIDNRTTFRVVAAKTTEEMKKNNFMVGRPYSLRGSSFPSGMRRNRYG